MVRDYHNTLARDPDTLPRYFMTGNAATMASSRVSLLRPARSQHDYRHRLLYHANRPALGVPESPAYLLLPAPA